MTLRPHPKTATICIGELKPMMKPDLTPAMTAL